MSAGTFSKAFYATDTGNIAPVRVQPETLTASVGGGANASAAGPATTGFPAVLISKSRRSKGIHPRYVTVEFSATPPAGYAIGGYYNIHIMQASVWAAVEEGDTGTYLSTAVRVISKSPELKR